MELNIAVVDDIEHDRTVIKNCLDQFFGDRRSCTVRTVNFSSAEDFLKAYRKGNFQIIFLDVCMGEMDGLALAGQLHIADREIGIIFMNLSLTLRYFTELAMPTAAGSSLTSTICPLPTRTVTASVCGRCRTS